MEETPTKYRGMTVQEYNKQYYELNKSRIGMKFKCSRCGGRYTHGNWSKHFETKKHLIQEKLFIEEEIKKFEEKGYFLFW